jgi:hypothetical protein
MSNSKQRKIGLGVILSLLIGMVGFLSDALDIKDRLIPKTSPAQNATVDGSVIKEIDPLLAVKIIYQNEVTLTDDGLIHLPNGEEVRVILSQPYQENNISHYVLISQRMDPAEFCHMCAPEVDGAIFTRVDDRWLLDVVQEGFAKLGYFGVAPEAELVQIGPDRFGYLFYFTGGSTGLTYTDAYLVAFFGEHFDVLLNERTRFDNSQACEPDFAFECWGYTSTLEFIQGENATYYDPHLVTSGSYQPEGEAIIPYDNEWVYSFSTGENRYLTQK